MKSLKPSASTMAKLYIAVGNKGDVISKMDSVAISYTICELSKGQALFPI